LRSVLDNQRGGAMVFVTLVGLVISMGFAMFLSSTVLVEQRAVEASLARSRAYWAEMGHIHYAMSRISLSRLCNSCGFTQNNITDVNASAIIQSYINELNAIKTWTYPEESSSYSLTITETVAPDEDPTRHVYSGWLKMTSSYTASSVLAGLDNHLPLMELRLCVGRGNAGAKCGNINNDNAGTGTAYFWITRLTNLPG
jgi:hypothetical protein